jgi:hypothetical protein
MTLPARKPATNPTTSQASQLPGSSEILATTSIGFLLSDTQKRRRSKRLFVELKGLKQKNVFFLPFLYTVEIAK